MDPETTPETPGNDLMDMFVKGLTSEEAPPEPTPEVTSEPTPEPKAEEKPVEEPAEAPKAEEEKPKEEESEKPEEEPKEEESEKPEEEPKEEDDDLKLEEGDKPKDEEEVIPDKPKDRKDWDILRASRDRYKQSSEEAVAEVEALRQQAAKVPEMEEKLKLLETYEKELAVTRLEVTREYKEAIEKPLSAIGQQAEVLAKTNEAEADRVYDILREADPETQRAAFKELTAGWDDVDRAELWSMAKDARVILDKQDAMRANASAAAKEQQTLEAERLKQEKEAATKEYVATAKDVVKSLREKTPDLKLADGETMEDKFSNIEQRAAAVDFESQPPRSKAFAVAAALIYPDMKKTMESQAEEIATLKARLKEDKETTPSVSTKESEKPKDDDGNKDFLESLGVPKSPMLSHSLNVVGQ